MNNQTRNEAMRFLLPQGCLRGRAGRLDLFRFYGSKVENIMAIVPGQSIAEHSAIKPSSFIVWCLLCDVRRGDDVYLDLEKAERIGIKKSAYYHAFNELADKNWIKFSRHFDGKKWWQLVKGFDFENSANVENQSETPTENSTNVETEHENRPNLSANVENSANVEKFESENSANVESHIRNNSLIPQDSNESFGGGEGACATEVVNALVSTKKPKPVKTRLPDDFELTDAMIDWAKREIPQLRLIQAHEAFIEHWANRTDAKSERVNWDLTWKKGMRLALDWQIRDEKAAKLNEVKNGKSNYGKFNNNKKSNGECVDEWREYFGESAENSGGY